MADVAEIHAAVVRAKHEWGKLSRIAVHVPVEANVRAFWQKHVKNVLIRFVAQKTWLLRVRCSARPATERRKDRVAHLAALAQFVTTIRSGTDILIEKM